MCYFRFCASGEGKHSAVVKNNKTFYDLSPSCKDISLLESVSNWTLMALKSQFPSCSLSFTGIDNRYKAGVFDLTLPKSSYNTIITQTFTDLLTVKAFFQSAESVRSASGAVAGVPHRSMVSSLEQVLISRGGEVRCQVPPSHKKSGLFV